jgi:hypothetical protein
MVKPRSSLTFWLRVYICVQEPCVQLSLRAANPANDEGKPKRSKPFGWAQGYLWYIEE